MRHFLRSALAVVLALMLAFTGQSMAVARGAPMVAGTMVLCTGTGPLTVSVDENGQPTGPAHICPDCALSLFDLCVGAPQMPVRPMGMGIAIRIDEAGLPDPVQVIPAAARGPPARG